MSSTAMAWDVELRWSGLTAPERVHEPLVEAHIKPVERGVDVLHEGPLNLAPNLAPNLTPNLALYPTLFSGLVSGLFRGLGIGIFTGQISKLGSAPLIDGVFGAIIE